MGSVSDYRYLRELVLQANVSLDAAAANVHKDSQAALDDLVAARLLTATALVALAENVSRFIT